jgi:hypothetical protein
MRKIFKTLVTGTLAMALHGIVFVSNATAQCGVPRWTQTDAVQPLPWQGAAPLRPAALLPAANKEGSDDRIVGFWKFKFVSEGTPGIPDGAVIDNGFVQWHSDGTEITNSSRPPATGNFCLGVWQKSGSSSYALNHFGLSWDPGGNFIGPAQIREDITLNRTADQYEGTFTIDQYDPAGNLLAHLEGRVTATRVGVNTAVGDVL